MLRMRSRKGIKKNYAGRCTNRYRGINMLTKITDDLFLNLDEILFVKKDGRDIHIKLKNDPTDIISTSGSRTGRALLKILNESSKEN